MVVRAFHSNRYENESLPVYSLMFDYPIDRFVEANLVEFPKLGGDDKISKRSTAFLFA